MSSTIISMLLTGIIVPFILGVVVYKSTTNKSFDSCTIKYPKFYGIVGFAGTLVTSVINVWILINRDQTSLALNIFFFTVFPIAFIAGLYLFLRGWNWRLILVEDYIIYRNLFGMVRKIEYKEIVKVKTYYSRAQQVEKYKIYTLKYTFTVEHVVYNFTEFPRILKKGLRKANNNIHF